MNATEQDHFSWLQERLVAYESKLLEAESTVSRLRPIVANLRGTIEVLGSDERGPTPPQDLFSRHDFNGASSTSSPLPMVSKPFTKGNQNPNMPDRRPEYAETTLLEAAGLIINAAPDIMHADDVTRAMFDIKSKTGFALAKHSMASELYRGAKKGLWNALGDNRYRRR